MSDLYNQLCNMLIRPMRQTYHAYDLGNPLISTHGKRQDFQILTRNNLKLKCSFYQPTNKQQSNINLQTNIIYLHSLNGSRLEFLSYVEPLIKLGFSISTFDFGGCGLSEGEYVTLGAHEQYDVLSMLRHIYKTYKICNFVIWGRSMGAVAGIKFYNLLGRQRKQQQWIGDIRLLGLVLDSPFISLNRLAIQIAKNKIRMPQLLIKMVFYMIQNSIEEKAKFKIGQLELQEDIKLIRIPTLIITSKKDTLVNYQHSLTIYNGISSKQKQLIYIDAQHNTNRSQKDVQKIYNFIISKTTSNQRTNIIQTVHLIRDKFSLQKSCQRLKPKSVKKYPIQIQNKQKLNRYQSQKNQIHFTKNNNFFCSNVTPQTNSQSYQINANINLKNARMRQISHQKIIIESHNQETQMHQVSKKLQSSIHQPYSAQRQKVFFNNQSLHQSSVNRSSIKKQMQTSKDKFVNKMAVIPEQRQREKPLYHTTSYKNIECLKTVKKIKRLEPQQNSKNKNQKLKQKQKQRQRQSFRKDQKDKQDNLINKQDNLKNHLNVITAKLKKKSKKGLTKSFLPFREAQHQSSTQNISESQRTLKKQINAKSSSILQFPPHFPYEKNNLPMGRSNAQAYKSVYQTQNINSSYRQIDHSWDQKPKTPVFFSNRQLLYSENVAKPFTPQFPLSSSKRINQITQRRQTSKQQISKFFSMEPTHQMNRGIKTSLHINNQSFQSKPKLNSSVNIVLTDQFCPQSQKPQFASSKKILNSKLMLMRTSNNFENNRVIIQNSHKRVNERENQTSIFLN